MTTAKLHQAFQTAGIEIPAEHLGTLFESFGVVPQQATQSEINEIVKTVSSDSEMLETLEAKVSGKVSQSLAKTQPQQNLAKAQPQSQQSQLGVYQSSQSNGQSSATTQLGNQYSRLEQLLAAAHEMSQEDIEYYSTQLAMIQAQLPGQVLSMFAKKVAEMEQQGGLNDESFRTLGQQLFSRHSYVGNDSQT